MHKEIQNYIIEYLEKTFEYMGINVKIEIEKYQEIYQVNLVTENPGRLIGTNGKNLDALQKLLGIGIRNQFSESVKFKLEISNYRKQKEEQFKKRIEKIAKEVETTKMEIKLDPMNSYQRRIVHEIIKEFPKLKSESIGEEPERYIIIKVKD